MARLRYQRLIGRSGVSGGSGDAWEAATADGSTRDKPITLFEEPRAPGLRAWPSSELVEERMGWLGKRRRKKEEQEEPEAVVDVQESTSTGTGIEVLVLVPEVAGAPTFRVNRFTSADDAVNFIKTSISAEVFPSAHIFWAMHEGPPPDVGAAGGEALVLIRAGDNRDAVHVVSFVDLESAESFARFEVKRGLDLGYVLIYWAAFAQVIETPFGLRLDPPGPPDPRQWRAAAISASHAAPAATPRRRAPAAMQAGDDYGPELKLMPETKLPEAPPRAREPERLAAQAYDERAEQATIRDEPAAVPESEPATEQAFGVPQVQEAEFRADVEPSVEAVEPEVVAEPGPAESTQPGSVQEPRFAEPPEVTTGNEAAAEEPPADDSAEEITGESEPAEAFAVDLEPEPGETVAIESVEQSEEEIAVPPEFAAESTETATSEDVEQDDQEVVVPPEFAAEPEAAVASTNGHHAEDQIPDDLRIDAPVTSSEGDEEVAERLLTEALGPGTAQLDPEPFAEEPASGPVATASDIAVSREVTPAYEGPVPPEKPAEPEPPKRKKAKAAASAKSSARHSSRDDDDEEEEEIIPVDVNEVVEKTLRVKRWKKQEEPFKGFDSPPGRF